MRYSSSIFSRRRVLCIFPAYTPSFGIFSHAYRLLPRVRAFMPPQGLLLIAAYLPASWSVRFIDENVTQATAADLGWADFVFVKRHAHPGTPDPRHSKTSETSWQSYRTRWPIRFGRTGA